MCTSFPVCFFPYLALKVTPYIYSQHLGVTLLCFPMEFKPRSVPKSCFTAPSDAACVDLFPTSKVNTTLVEGPSFTIYLKGMLLAPHPPPLHHFSLHILLLIVLRINILEINRRHIYILDISTSKSKTS